MSEESPYWGEGKVWKTKSAFLSWIRGGVRRSLWNRSPIKINFINKHRKRIKNPNPKGKVPTVWGGNCSICTKDYVISNIEVDHKFGGHSLREVEDIQKFVEGIVLVTEDDLQMVCKPCHKIKSYAEKEGIPHREAKAIKEAIEIIKAKGDKLWLIDKGVEPMSSQAKRRSQIIEVLSKEQE